MKKITATSLLVGEMLENHAFYLAEITEKDKDTLQLVLSDTSGMVRAFMPKANGFEELTSFVKKVVQISGPILVDENARACIKVTAIALAEQGTYRSSDIITTLPMDVINRYVAVLAELVKSIENENYRTLVNVCFSKQNIIKMANLPASLNWHCSLKGGMLEAIVAVTKQAKDFAHNYVALNNGVYSSQINFDLLLTAGLLHNYGNFAFYTNDEPVKRSQTGILQGYITTLIISMKDVITKNEIPITEEEFAALCGIWNHCSGYKSSTAPASTEATLLKGVYDLFQHLDQFDAAKARHAGEEGIVYDPRIRSYIKL